MPLTIVEDNASRTATIARLGRRAQSVMKRSYKIFGSTNDVEVHDFANRNIVRFWEYPGAGFQSLEAESYTLEYLGDDAWHLEVNYAKDGGVDSDEDPNPLRRSRSFDTGGGTTHVTQAKGTPAPAEKRYPNSESAPSLPASERAPDQKGAIGVDASGVQGVDIVIPSLTWTETYDVPSSYVDSAYIRNLSKVTGTVNNATFRGFPAGEVLFLGASGSQDWDQRRGDGPWTLSFKFVQSPNAGPGNTGPNPVNTLPPLTIGSIQEIAKKGHEYLWVRYEDNIENNALVKEPKYVYVNKVYREENFSQLGIGVQ
jgi:hypothetical protein